MRFTVEMAKELVKSFGDGEPETVLVVVELDERKGPDGPGLYSYYEEYPDEGVYFLGKLYPDENEATTEEAVIDDLNEKQRAIDRNKS